MGFTKTVKVFKETVLIAHKKGAGRLNIHTEEMIADAWNRMQSKLLKSIHKLQETSICNETLESYLEKNI